MKIGSMFTFILTTLSAQSALAEKVDNFELFKDQSGYPCMVTMVTDQAKEVTLQLSDYKEVWSIHLLASNRPDTYKKFFDSNDIHDADAFRASFQTVEIGDTRLDLHEAWMFGAITISDLDEKTTAILSINEEHNVVRALNAMASDTISVPDLFNISGVSKALSEFQACSLDAMGIQKGSRVETDYRAEYRMIFERSFEDWIKHMSRAETCMVAKVDSDAISSVVDDAADAFFPGVMNTLKRKDYREELNSRIPSAKLSGMVDAQSDGCMMAGSLAEAARMPVDLAIQAATDVR